MKKLLIVVDYQNDFINGSLGFEKGELISKVIKEKIECYLKNNNDIIYTLDTHDNEYLKTVEGNYLPVVHCIKDSIGHQIYKECDYSNKAVKVFEKETFPSLDLANYLFNNKYQEIELCGLVSNICVLSNAIMVKSALPNAHIFIDALATASSDEKLQEEAFNVLEALHIDIINR